MEFLKAFVLDGTEHKLNILWENDEPLFRANEVGKVLGIVNIRTSIKSFDDTEKVVHPMYTLGGEQETTFLTETGLYRLLTVSKKPAARPFQKWVYEVIKSIRQTGKYELENLVEKGVQQALEQEAARHKREVEMATHRSLVEAFRNRPVVYFGKIREEADGKTLIKIGSTNDIFNRMFSLTREFGSMTLFHVIEATVHRKFEEYLQTHPKVSCYAFKEEIHEGRRSNREVFLMTQTEIEALIARAKKNTYKFATDNVAERMIEVHRLKLQAAEARVKEQELKLEMARITRADTETNMEGDNDDASTIPDITYQERRYTQGRGPKIQRYSPDGKSLLATYPGTAEATRDATINNPSGKGIRDAIERRSVYKGFRWAALLRELPDDTVQAIGDTVQQAGLQKGFVAMLSLDKTRVVQVFCDQRAAAENRQFVGCAPISMAIKNGTKSGGHYFQMWHDVSQELKDAYLATNALPEKRISPRARAIEQLNPVTGEVVQRFTSMVDITKSIRVARASLQDAIANGHILKAYIWRYADTD